MLELRNVSKSVGVSRHITDVSLTLESGSLNVLLGPTLAGKTSLMRLMAGLDVPTAGTIHVDGQDVTGVPVQRRNVAMVYQQFINYPSLTVYENIASPLRVKGVDRATIDRDVKRAAELMRLTPYLDRTPLSLSGGQQQRTALARAMVKQARLVLLDEPLANLDYKLREELREELPKIFAETGAIFVYATTEPQEALLLGGNTAVMHEGRIAQFGRTIEVFRHPVNLTSARTFADPPLNTLSVHKTGDLFAHGGLLSVPVPDTLAHLPDGAYTIALQPHHLVVEPEGAALVALDARVDVTEITGSESFIHVAFADARWVILAAGVLEYDPEQVIRLGFDLRNLLIFGADGHAVEHRTAKAA
ncbi:ABC transporter ATP-binding protein [Rhizobium straminoryzae]|uniref:ABC transporter ATP-binding protein n=1 Tax=Rhizobium straminoryzae TaxID=1387186 RepID=A0A549THE1_9HYPH|nr:ABC transporter ATP-binding protein [Rhizobium straminoryzae]TRL42447.1 ABC transporter ATP-binding protein [Rhizobium straminoryzae]